MALAAKVIEFVGLDTLYGFKYSRRIIEITVVKKKTFVPNIIVIAKVRYSGSIDAA
jgi:hypothetical protein